MFSLNECPRGQQKTEEPASFFVWQLSHIWQRPQMHLYVQWTPFGEYGHKILSIARCLINVTKKTIFFIQKQFLISCYTLINITAMMQVDNVKSHSSSVAYISILFLQTNNSLVGRNKRKQILFHTGRFRNSWPWSVLRVSKTVCLFYLYDQNVLNTKLKFFRLLHHLQSALVVFYI